jgi:hypothetical protein
MFNLSTLTRATLVASALCCIAPDIQADITGRQITLPRWGLTSNGQLGLGDARVERFEDANLEPGLQIAVRTGNGSYGPTSTLPSVYNTSVDAFGTAFLNLQWDGVAALINTATNQTRFYNDGNNWGDIELIFDPPVKLVAFSIAQREVSTIVSINGTVRGDLFNLTGINTSSGRGGYAIFEATGSDTISSIVLDNRGGDGFVIDAVAYTPSPRPAVTADGVSAPLWGASNAEIGMAGAVIENFEDNELIPRLQVEWNAPAGTVGPTGTLPALFDPVAQDPFGNAFDNGVWDGQRGLISGRGNQSYGYQDGTNWGDVALRFDPPAIAIGMSVQQLDNQARIIVNDRDIGAFTEVTGLPVNASRSGYMLLTSTDPANISSVRFANFRTATAGDGIMIDHLGIRGCGGDFNADGFLDFFDYDAFVSCFEGSECPPGQTADFNGDGFADFFDYDDYVSAFESGC